MLPVSGGRAYVELADHLLIDYCEELTRRETGEVLDVTESRVSQLHAKAILRPRIRPDVVKARRSGPSRSCRIRTSCGQWLPTGSK